MGCEGRETAQFLLPATGQTMEIFPGTRHEVEFIYREIFEHDTYSKHGVAVSAGDVVVDVGANIGMFYLHAASRAAAADPPVTYYGIEALPPVFEVLRRNVLRLPERESGGRRLMHVKALLNVALGDQVRSDVPFTLFPRVPGNSTFNVPEKMRVQEGMVEPHVYEGATQYLVPMCTLSDVIDEHAIERIDYLKVDVEGAELLVLKGIKDPHWSRIWKVVIEVPDVDEEIDNNGTIVLMKRAHLIIDLFKKHGFEVNIEGDSNIKSFMVYARREVV